MFKLSRRGYRAIVEALESRQHFDAAAIMVESGATTATASVTTKVGNAVSFHVPLYSGLSTVDVGAPGTAGTSTEVTYGKDYDLTVGTGDVSGTADQCHFDYELLTGDFDTKLQLSSFTGNSSAKAGIMV